MLAAGLLAPRGRASPLPPAADVPLIDRAEVLLEFVAMIVQLDERNLCNVNHDLDVLYRSSEGSAEDILANLATVGPLAIGEGQRICDLMDAEEALKEGCRSGKRTPHADYLPSSRQERPGGGLGRSP